MSFPLNLPEGVEADRTCECEQQAAFRLEARMVNSRERPQNLVSALVILASAKPITVDRTVIENGQKKIIAVRNPEHNPLDTVVVATYEQGFDFCSLDCLHNEIDKIWTLAHKRATKLWGNR